MKKSARKTNGKQAKTNQAADEQSSPAMLQLVLPMMGAFLDPLSEAMYAMQRVTATTTTFQRASKTLHRAMNLRQFKAPRFF